MIQEKKILLVIQKKKNFFCWYKSRKKYLQWFQCPSQSEQESLSTWSYHKKYMKIRSTLISHASKLTNSSLSMLSASKAPGKSPAPPSSLQEYSGQLACTHKRRRKDWDSPKLIATISQKLWAELFACMSSALTCVATPMATTLDSLWTRVESIFVYLCSTQVYICCCFRKSKEKWKAACQNTWPMASPLSSSCTAWVTCNSLTRWTSRKTRTGKFLWRGGRRVYVCIF